MKDHHLSLCCSCCFLFISFCVTGSGSTFVQTIKSPYSLVKDQAEISCVMTNVLDQEGVYWYRQSSKSTDVEFVVYSTVLEKAIYGNSISKERFSVSREKFRNTYTLKISNLQLSDSGLYYCLVEQTRKMYFGNGTILHVVETLPSTVAPKPQTTPCRCSKTQTPTRPVKGYCGAIIWAPLAGCAIFLLIFLGFCISRTHRAYRRSRLFFKKMQLQK